MQLLSTQSVTVLSTHQFEVLNELDGGLSLVRRQGVVTLEHTLEGPLCPLVIDWVAGANLAFPVERETNLVQL